MFLKNDQVHLTTSIQIHKKKKEKLTIGAINLDLLLNLPHLQVNKRRIDIVRATVESSQDPPRFVRLANAVQPPRAI